MSTRINKGIRLLLVEQLDLKRMIHKSKRLVDTLQAAINSVEIRMSNGTIHLPSIDTVHPTSIDPVHLASFDTVHLITVHLITVHPDTVHPDTVHHVLIDTVHPVLIDTAHPLSIDTIHPASIDTIHHATIYRNTVHPDTVHHDTVCPDTAHQVSTGTTCVETKKVEVLILKVDENEILRDNESRARKSTGQLIYSQGTAIPDAIIVAESDDFELKPIYIELMCQHPFHGFPHEDPVTHINMFVELVSYIFKEVPEDYHFCKLFSNSLAGEASCWFKKLTPGSFNTWNHIENAFLNKFLLMLHQI